MPSELWAYLQGRDPGELARDALDVLITYYVFYRVALVLRGTRALQVGFGLALVFLLYVVAQLLHLHTVLTLLKAVLSSAILIGVVVFQNDIRRGLMRMGSRASFGGSHHTEAQVVDSVVDAATQLARHRIGAIITFEQEANLDEFVGSHTGFAIDAAVSTDLLVSMFIPEGVNKLHDGAVIIRDLRIAKAGVFFPMPEGKVMDQSFGSRHRAAMGITEETDAIVIVVSEERGSISFCFNGNIVSNLDGERLRAALEGVLAPKRARKRTWLPWLRQKPAAPMLPTEVVERKTLPVDEVVTPPPEPKPQPTPPAEATPIPLRKLTDEEAKAKDKEKPKDAESEAETTEAASPAATAKVATSEESPKSEPTAKEAPTAEATKNEPIKEATKKAEPVPTPLRHLAGEKPRAEKSKAKDKPKEEVPPASRRLMPRAETELKTDIKEKNAGGESA